MSQSNITYEALREMLDRWLQEKIDGEAEEGKEIVGFLHDNTDDEGE